MTTPTPTTPNRPMGLRPLGKPGLRPVGSPPPRPGAPAAAATTQPATPPAPPVEAELEEVAAQPQAEVVTAAAAPKPTVAKPAPAAKAAAPAAKKVSAPAAPAATAPAEAATSARGRKDPYAEGSYKPRLEVKLPEIGGRITLESTRELWHRFVVANSGEFGLNPNAEPTKELTSRLLMKSLEFLFGKELNKNGKSPLPEATADSIVENGGLARLFDVRLRGDIAFTLQKIAERTYPNPRQDSEPGTLIQVRDRTHVKLLYTSEAGTALKGTRGADGSFLASDAALPPDAAAEIEGQLEDAEA